MKEVQNRSPSSEIFIKDLQIYKELKIHLLEAISSYKKFADRQRRDVTNFDIGDLVYLSTKNLPLKWPSSKLGPLYIGPFLVLESIGEVAYRIKLPKDIKYTMYFMYLNYPSKREVRLTLNLIFTLTQILLMENLSMK